MHGVKRTRISPEALEVKRLKELSKIESYSALQDDILSRKRSKDYSQAALDRTTSLLDLNPEFYTIWNYRRHILTRGLFPAMEASDIVALLTTDLRLTMSYLKVHPKVYWIWSHRKWCLENVPLGPNETEEWRNEFWKMELMVVEKMLDADARNFHAWDYRRYILASLPATFKPHKTPLDELAYTTKKIESNFSNFSAWHCRTKVLGELWKSLDSDQVETEKEKEFELVTQALWTDPGDLSGWLYHRWLIGDSPHIPTLRRELSSIKELHEAEPDSKWCLNALSHYYLLLARSQTVSDDERTSLRSQAKDVLRRLEEVDADRRARYRDLAEQL